VKPLEVTVTQDRMRRHDGHDDAFLLGYGAGGYLVA
jgi:hypothetical protein